MFKKQRTRKLWGRDFDIVKDGLAEHQVSAFVEDLLKHYKTVLAELKRWDSLRMLAEMRLGKARELAGSILQEAGVKATEEIGQFPRGPVAGDADKVSLEKKAEATVGQGEQNQHRSIPSLQEPRRGDRGTDHTELVETISDPSDEVSGLEVWPSNGKAEYHTAEGDRANHSLYEIDIFLQSSELTAEPVHMARLLEYLENSPEVSVKGYEWSPSLGWAITVSAYVGRSLTPLLLGMPEVERVAPEQSESKAAILSPSQGERNPSSQRWQTPREKLLVWLKEGDVPVKAGDLT